MLFVVIWCGVFVAAAGSLMRKESSILLLEVGRKDTFAHALLQLLGREKAASV